MNNNYKLAGQRNYIFGRLINFSNQIIGLVNNSKELTVHEKYELSLVHNQLQDIISNKDIEWIDLKKKLKFKNVESG